MYLCNQARLTAGATSTCWTFATTRENRTPCKVPMIETETTHDGNPCPDGQFCVHVAENFIQTFVNDGYVISLGATIVCKIEGKSFTRGMIKQSIGEDVN